MSDTMLRLGLLLCLVILISGNQPIAAQQSSQKEIVETKGYRGFLEVGYGLGTGKPSRSDRFEFTITNGRLFNPYFYAGFGIGYSLYTDAPTAVVIPTFLDVRYNFTFLRFGQWYPFFNMKFGLEWGVDDGYFGAGYYTVPTIGIKRKMGKKTALNVSLGYAMTDLTGVLGKVGFEF